MAIKLNPYLGFRDNTRQAMEFYKSVFGGKLDMSTFKEFHATENPSEENLIMHAVLESERLTLMAADTPKRMEHKPGNNVSLSLNGDIDDEAEMRGYFEKLSEGGNVTLKLEKAMWGDIFGMLVDKFDIQWLINIAGKKQ